MLVATVLPNRLVQMLTLQIAAEPTQVTFVTPLATAGVLVQGLVPEGLWPDPCGQELGLCFHAGSRHIFSKLGSRHQAAVNSWH